MIERREYRIFKPWVIYISEILLIISSILLLSWFTGFYVFAAMFFVFCFIKRTKKLVEILNRQRNLKDGFHMKKFWER